MAKEKKMVKVPAPGFTWNPMTSFPVNAQCPCGSGIKFKKCHKDKISPYISTDKETDDIKQFIKLVKESRK